MLRCRVQRRYWQLPMRRQRLAPNQSAATAVYREVIKIMSLRTAIKGFSAIALLAGIFALPATARADDPASCDAGGPGARECSLEVNVGGFGGKCKVTCIAGYACCSAAVLNAGCHCVLP